MPAERALDCLIDSLACALQALKHPDCVRFIGPVVPGATMAGGARVPGTSYDLDPVQAAFCIGAMVGWLECNDASLATDCGHPSETFGGILAVADYLSRKAIAEGRPALTVTDVMTAAARAHAIQGLASLEQRVEDRAPRDLVNVRIATAAVATALLGGTEQQVANAVWSARADGRAVFGGAGVASPGPRSLGDANSRGVRLALLVMNDGHASASPSTATDVAIWRVLQEPAASATATTSVEATERGRRIVERFETSAAGHFPPAQTNRIKALFGNRPQLVATPVHECLAVLVKNH